MAAKTKNNLEGFLDLSLSILSEFMEQLDKYVSDKRLRTVIMKAWPEAKKSLTQALIEIKEVAKTKKGWLNNSLENAGLTGKQLTLKFKGSNNAGNKWMKSKTRKDLGRFLSWMLIILESLSKCFPWLEIPIEFSKSIQQILHEENNKKKSSDNDLH
jgi:hypothetical protein